MNNGVAYDVQVSLEKVSTKRPLESFYVVAATTERVTIDWIFGGFQNQ